MVPDHLGHRVQLEDGIGVKQRYRSSILPGSSCANETFEQRAGAEASREDLFFSLARKKEICSPFVELSYQRN